MSFKFSSFLFAVLCIVFIATHVISEVSEKTIIPSAIHSVISSRRVRQNFNIVKPILVSVSGEWRVLEELLCFLWEILSILYDSGAYYRKIYLSSR